MRRFIVLGILAFTSWGLATQVTLVATDPAPLPGAQVGLTVSGVPAGAQLYWDFGGDGTVDQVTQAPAISYTVKAGYQEVAVQVHHQGKAIGSARIALSADPFIGAYRQVVSTKSGVIQVEIIVVARTHLFGVGVVEDVPISWGIEVSEVTDNGSGIVGPNVNEEGQLEVGWMEMWPGDEVKLTYFLYPPSLSVEVRLLGIVSGYTPFPEDKLIEVQIGGAVVVP